MSAYVVRRLLQTLPMLLGTVVLAFVLIHVAPGDPIVALAGEYGNEAYYEAMRAKFGLDQPLPQQLLIYVSSLLRGDLGTSYGYGRPVRAVIGDRLPATLLLMGTSLVLSTIIGIGLGTAAARRPRSFADLGISTLALTGYALPVFWLAQMLILLFALHLDLFPVQGMTSARHRYQGWRYLWDVARHMVLPVTALTVQQLALITRLTRTGLVDVLGQDHVRTARAKGLRQRQVLIHHGLRNALLPVVTVVGGRIGFLFAGAVLTETVFAWPGIGQLLIAATFDRDFPILLGLFLLVSFSVIVANLMTDLAYVFFDPRVQYD